MENEIRRFVASSARDIEIRVWPYAVRLRKSTRYHGCRVRCLDLVSVWVDPAVRRKRHMTSLIGLLEQVAQSSGYGGTFIECVHNTLIHSYLSNTLGYHLQPGTYPGNFIKVFA